MNKPKNHILPIIVISQFCCTSLWFAGNGVMTDLVTTFSLSSSAVGHLTSAVQFGFIIGTLCFAILSIADRFSPSKVFFLSAILGATFNFGVIWEVNTLTSLLALRFLTGFFLAGIYPIGMKIAADYFDKGLGKSLGFLVGALVLGTAFPHLLKDITKAVSWELVLILTSSLAITGGSLMVLLVPDGPFRKAATKPDFSAFLNVFEVQNFRAAAFGYFGHMWELYTFWAFVPIMLNTYNLINPAAELNIPLFSFLIIGIGGLACIIGGYISQYVGTKKTAFIVLSLSGLCCLVSPLAFSLNSEWLFIGFLLFWGMTVVADSPLFSTLVAQNAPAKIKGTALTIVNSIGFTITIISIQLVTYIAQLTNSNGLFMILAVGPILGLIALSRKANTVH